MGAQQVKEQSATLSETLQNRPLPDIPLDHCSRADLIPFTHEDISIPPIALNGTASFGITTNHRWLSRENLHQIEPKEQRSNSDETADPQLFVALYEFQSGGENQLSLKKGEQVKVLSYNKSGEWCEAKSSSGLVGWVPSNYITPVNSLDKHSWYHGQISRSDAEYLLSSGINGSFLVRESESSPGQRSISLRFDGRVYHYRINEDSEGKVYVTSECRFNTLAELVHHHSMQADGLITMLLYPAPKCNKPTLFALSPEPDEWEIDRTDIIMRHKLGGGQYGDVYEALWKRYNLKVAVKTLKEDTMALKDFLEEARVELTDVYHMLESGYRMECPPGCPPRIYELMQQSWQWDPNTRPTFREMRETLETIAKNYSITEEVEKQLLEQSLANPLKATTSNNVPSNNSLHLRVKKFSGSTPNVHSLVEGKTQPVWSAMNINIGPSSTGIITTKSTVVKLRRRNTPSGNNNSTQQCPVPSRPIANSALLKAKQAPVPPKRTSSFRDSTPELGKAGPKAGVSLPL
ncbi:tyrosine-protein kinase Abl-like protein [Dinothrombium tinctorium]|uniref:Tyrosine-protein kinase n=1 Tax=Dinothrombium tinctorium TaxID=1965070 RepID=A0A3S3PBD9_9ACAR|nr:tyrosine-protein kinase Abl-like protein [Dinothrombium tinctorium]RWS10389.1 tyrosine-protein kinase Abl-like protein [Dinothrombium tinctorium]RWS11230.1 tyrosine-protein kinase Abl-like protein [Dinothrombium tinctorium]